MENLKEKILDALLTKSELQSGAELADMFSVSRNAVCKAVHSLIEEGYPIAVKKNKGYELPSKFNKLSKEAINFKSGLSLPVIVYDSTDSTNSQAKRLSINPPFLVCSDAQTEGRVRMGRTFYSPKGGIYFTYCFAPSSSDCQKYLAVTSFAAVAVCLAVKALTGKNCKIKWVNDVYLEGKKLAGILTEATTSLESGMMERIYVGIGINLLPFEQSSLKEGAAFLMTDEIKNDLIASVLKDLFDYERKKEEYMRLYRELSMVIGKKVCLTKDGERLTAVALSVDDEGGLTVRLDKNGKTETIRSGEVSLRPL